MATSAGGNSGNVQSFKASADLSALQYHCVRLSAANTVAAGTDAEHDVIGVLQDKPEAANSPATVQIGGVSKAEAGGTIAAGDWVVCGTDSKVRNDEPADTADSVFVGLALEAATAKGDIISMLIRPQIGTVS